MQHLEHKDLTIFAKYNQNTNKTIPLKLPLTSFS